MDSAEEDDQAVLGFVGERRAAPDELLPGIACPLGEPEALDEQDPGGQDEGDFGDSASVHGIFPFRRHNTYFPYSSTSHIPLEIGK